jgi:hypothetical protein
VDYSALIQRAWSITWHHRFLWLLALFAGSGGATCSGGSGSTGAGGGSEDFDLDQLRRQAGPDVQRAFDEIARWIAQNIGLLLAIGAILALIMGVFLVFSLLCQGAIARATIDLALGRPTSLGQSLGDGRRLFWRYAGLLLIMLGLGLAVLLTLGVIGALFWAGRPGPGGPLGPFLVLIGLFGGSFLGLLIVGGIILGVIVAYAQRVIADEGLGPLAALGRGWRLLWSNKATSAIAWLVSIVVSIAAGLGIALGVVVLLIPLGIVGAIFFAAGGVSALSIGYAVLAGGVFFIALLVAAAALNALLWSLWTLIYLYVVGRLSPKMEPLPAPAAPPSTPIG